MRTLSDLLVGARRLDHETRSVADALRLPARNHYHTDGDPFRGLVDRYVVEVPTEELVDSAMGHLFEDDFLSREVIDRFRFRLPAEGFWVEHGHYGWYVLGGRHVFCVVRESDSSARCVFAFNLIETVEGVAIDLNDLADSLEPDAQDLSEARRVAELMAVNALRFACLCTLLTQPNTADVRQVIRGKASRAERRALQRAMQRGRPMFSFNRVTMKPGRTSIHRGEVVETALVPGKRAHWVTGHWRLIVPTNGTAAYFTWVDSHESGDPVLGRIVKEHHVKPQTPSEIRKGYRVPDFAGERGVRVAAAPAQSGMGASSLPHWFR